MTSSDKGAYLFKIILNEEELQLPAIDDLRNKYYDWIRLFTEPKRGRGARSANKRADAVYEEIMNFELPPIKETLATTNPISSPKHNAKGFLGGSCNSSTKSSLEVDSSENLSVNSSGNTGRILRPRCRTPSVSRQKAASPSTPAHQSIRAHMKRNAEQSSTPSNVLHAALNQQHPSVSVTKIRQLLRADSAQKKREEEKERLEQVKMQRKAKEERAEAQKRQLLEERAITAKLNREKRLLHAAEVRKARERTRIELKLREEPLKRQCPSQVGNTIDEVVRPVDTTQTNEQEYTKPKEKLRNKELPEVPSHQPDPIEEKKVETEKSKDDLAPVDQANKDQGQPSKPRKMDETFQKPPEEIDNIDISVCDETMDDQKKHPTPIASWAKAPGLRDVVVAQYSKPTDKLMREALSIFRGVKLPVRLDEIFGPIGAGNKYLSRTSSALWTPHKAFKRTSSDVLTPTDPKRQA